MTTGRPVGEDICKGVVDPSPTGALARLSPLNLWLEGDDACTARTEDLVGAHNRLIDVINALADLVVVLDQRLALIEECLDLGPEPPLWEDIVVKGDLL